MRYRGLRNAETVEELYNLPRRNPDIPVTGYHSHYSSAAQCVPSAGRKSSSFQGGPQIMSVQILRFSVIVCGFSLFVCEAAACRGEPMSSAEAAGAAVASPDPVNSESETGASTSPVFATDVCLSGVWSGKWSSQSTGHSGPMNADFRRLNSCQYEVTFTGKFCKLIPFRYRTVLHSTIDADGVVQLTGSRYLGPLVGTFRFRGTVNGNCLTARYWSEDDCGTFTMNRCCR